MTPRWWRPLSAVVLTVAGLFLVVAPQLVAARARGTSAGAAGRATPLSPLERAALDRGQVAAASLPAALASVPTAVVDAARTGRHPVVTTPAQAMSLLAGHAELAALTAASRNPAALAGDLTNRLAAAGRSPEPPPAPSVPFLLLTTGAPGCVATAAGLALALAIAMGRPPPRRAMRRLPAVVAVVAIGALFLPALPGGSSVWAAAGSAPTPGPGSSTAASAVGADLTSLQTVYGEIVPAVQLGAATSGKGLSAGQAVGVILADPRLVPLQRLIVGLPNLYGAGVLAMKAATATGAAPAAAAHARAELPAVVIGPALALLLIPLLGALWAHDAPSEVDPEGSGTADDRHLLSV